MRLLLFLFCFLVLSSTSWGQDSQALDTIIKQLNEFQAYDRNEHPLGLYTEEVYYKEAEFAQELLQDLDQINRQDLSETEQITAELLRFRLQEDVDFYSYEAYLNPLLSDYGFHLSLPYHVGTLTSRKAVENYLEKLRALPQFVDQHLTLLREGLQKGITQPRVIFNGYESTYNDQIVDEPTESYYYSPFLALPEVYSASEKDSIRELATILIAEKVIPQFVRIKSFFETEYFPQTRTAIGVSEIPGGKDYYQNRLNYYTTLDLTAQEIHQIGLQEVERINKEMKKIITALDYEGDFSDFIDFLRTDAKFYAQTEEELLKEARDIAKRIDAQLPRFFHKLPRRPYGVAPVPEAIAPKYTTGRYIGARSDTQPGYYWVNTYDLPSRPLYVLPALTAHEAVPGHHLQIERNAELSEDFPSFRKNFYLSAFGEGWGLYAEFLAEEMGIYTTPYEQFGKFTYEQWRACRLVVDTGIHAMGWSREEAVDFLRSNTALSLHEINTEIDRYISWPGQAVSYKIGEIKIRELRQRAEKSLGEYFDIRDFHEVILSQGTVTLKIMEDRVNNWIKERKAEIAQQKNV